MERNQKERTKEKELSKSLEQKEEQVSTSGLKSCSNCGHKNESEAMFCEECGNPFGSHICPNCKAMVHPHQDVCEECGAWILTDQCKFCYSPISPEDKFCAECGNPTEGIICPGCSTLNFFDFCTKCHKPLTEAALAEIQRSKSDPEQMQIRSFIAELEELEIELGEDAKLSKTELMEMKLQEQIEKEEEILRQKAEEIRQIKEQLNSFLPPKETKKESPPTTINKKPKVNNFNKLQEKIKERELKRKNLLNNIQTKLNEMQSRTFDNSQSARRFFNANRPPGNYVWNCNFNDSIHPDPNNCGSPEKGGKWIIEYGEIKWRTHHGEC